MFDDDLVGQTTLPFSVLAQDQLTKLQHLPTPAKKNASTPNRTARHFFSLGPLEKRSLESAEPLTTHPFSPNVSCPEDPKHGASSCSGCSPDRTTPSQSNASNGSVGASPSLAEPRFDDAAQHYDELPMRLHPFWLPESCLVVCAPLQALVPPQQRSLLRPPILQHRPRRPSTPEE